MNLLNDNNTINTIYTSEEEERLQRYDFVGRRSVHIFLANEIHLEWCEDNILVYFPVDFFLLSQNRNLKKENYPYDKFGVLFIMFSIVCENTACRHSLNYEGFLS